MYLKSLLAETRKANGKKFHRKFYFHRTIVRSLVTTNSNGLSLSPLLLIKLKEQKILRN